MRDPDFLKIKSEHADAMDEDGYAVVRIKRVPELFLLFLHNRTNSEHGYAWSSSPELDETELREELDKMGVGGIQIDALVQRARAALEDKSREPCFDIFCGFPGEKDAVWIARAAGLVEARALMEKIAAARLAPYFVLCAADHSVLAKIDTRPRRGTKADAA